MASEKWLIDANALKAHFPTTGIFPDDLWHSATIRATIDDAPTVDAVEVVRCKDCKWRCNGKDCDHPLLLSWSWGAIRNVKDDDFCSYGERKDNERKTD